MKKYSTEFKLKVVNEYLEGKIGYTKLARKYNIPDTKTIRVWVNAYQTMGYEGIAEKTEIKTYSWEFKLNAVNLYLTEEISYQALANQLKVNEPSLITRWVREFKAEALEIQKEKGIPPKMSDKNKKKKTSEKMTAMEKELEDLRNKNYWLEMEVDILKKKIQFDQMTDAEIDEYLQSLNH